MGESTSHPYSLAMEAQGVVYVSGAAGIDYERHVPVPGRRPCVDAALAEVEKRLHGADCSLDNVAKMTYFLTDITLRNEANAQFEEVFAEPRPARTVLGVQSLPYGAQVVIECVAHRDWQRAG
jgi:enamine deaminase RidA (YjgF/YER057c/UK114 family)